MSRRIYYFINLTVFLINYTSFFKRYCINFTFTKVIYGEDPAKFVSPRFESNRSAVENLIVTTLRETLSRRGTSGASGLSHGGDVALSNSTSNDYFQIRSLLRTIGLAAGIPEVRSLAAQKLEIWFAVSA